LIIILGLKYRYNLEKGKKKIEKNQLMNSFFFLIIY
jgi:hypothetical protein